MSLNKILLIGNLGADPEIKYTASGSQVANLRLATTERWKDKQSGQNETRTEWHRVIFFNRLAEISGEYLKKGSKIYVEGSIRTNKWQDSNGQDRYTTEIIGRELQMLDSKPVNGSSGDSGSQATAQAAVGTGYAAPNEDFEDHIPF